MSASCRRELLWPSRDDPWPRLADSALGVHQPGQLQVGAVEGDPWGTSRSCSMHSSTAVPEWWSNEAKTPIWRRQINKRISCFRLRWLFGAAQRGLGRICFGGPLPSGPWGWVGLCDCSFGGHQVLLSSTESLERVPNNSIWVFLAGILIRLPSEW